ncbi:MAG: plasmid pRiA4b ORF-3 family protein [Acidimicrobiales bacterium]
MPLNQPSDQSFLRLRIQLDDIDPVIWRRLLVPGEVSMAKLAGMLIAAMGWTKFHLHEFKVGGASYGIDFDDVPEGQVDEKDVTVLQALSDVKHFTFEYDFGDSWKHEVVIEELGWSYFRLKYGVCVDGANSCPPEDVGGISGYAGFLEAISDPSNGEHQSCLDLVGGSFDPAEFNLANVNALLQKVR